MKVECMIPYCHTLKEHQCCKPNALFIWSDLLDTCAGKMPLHQGRDGWMRSRSRLGKAEVFAPGGYGNVDVGTKALVSLIFGKVELCFNR